MDTTISWWDCPRCGVDAELPSEPTVIWAQLCPDCTEPMLERCTWDVAA